MMHRPVFGNVFALAILAILCTTGCSGGGKSPTEPPPFSPPGSGSATVTGEVTGGAAGGVTSGAEGLRGIAAADRSGAGFTVRVSGTGLSTSTDANGQFTLAGIPSGNQVLIFESSSASAALSLDSIQAGEQIDLTVKVQGSTATVESIHRSSDSPEDGPSIDVGELELEIAPEEWNLNFVQSSGTVAAFIRGNGIDEIDLASLEMRGDDPDAAALTATRSELRGDHVRAEFPKDSVIDLLLDPEPGSVHTIEVSFTAQDSEERLALTFDIVVADEEDDGGGNDDGGDGGDDGGGDDGGGGLGNLTLQISPDSWNLNFRRSSGTVTAFIRGDGLDEIDLSSILMEGDNDDAEPLAASTARLEGEHVRAQFPKNQVLDLLDEPERGSTHEITIEFLDQGGESHELTQEIRVVGNG